MKENFEHLAFRVFQYFEQRDATLAKTRAISFLAILQGSFFIPLFMVSKLIFHFEAVTIGHNDNFKYYFGIPAALMLWWLNSYYFRNRFNEAGIRALKEKYQQTEYSFSIWWIFLMPVLFTFVIPLIFAILNGTIEFPLLNPEE